MKTNRKWINGLAVAATVFSLAASARAGIYTWSAPATITTADTTLNQTGTVVGGASFGTLERIVTLTNGTVIDFKVDGSVATATGQGTFGSANTNQTGNANFNTVLTQASYDGGPKTITLNNLTVGVQYSVQLFALDDRGGGAGARQANFSDPNDGSNVSATFRMSDNVYVIGTFTATAPTQSIQENLITDTGGNMNALVVRQLSSLPVAPQIVVQPQPTTIYNGRTAQLTVAAYGTALAYQWQKSSVGGGVFTNVINTGRISGATNLTLIITNLAAGDTGDYQVVITNAAGLVTTTPATLTVQAGTPLFAWATPVAISGADATLNTTGTVVGAAVFGTAEKIVTLTNGTVIDFKADGSSAAVTAGGQGKASGAFTGDTGNVNFNAALTQFNYDGGPKIITLNNLVGGQQYSVQLFALDDRGGLSSVVRANFQDPNDSADVSDTVAMGDNMYIVGTFTAPGSGTVSVNIQENLPDNGGGGNINALVIRALGALVAPQITLQPQSATIDQSLNTKFTVAASGSTPFTYLWQRGAIGSGIFTNVPSNSRYAGLTASTLMITNLVVGDSADYQVIVANAVGSVTSSPPATLSVQSVTPQFVWAAPAAITTADVTLAQAGSIVGAEVLGPTPKIVVLTNGMSVDFKNGGAVATADGDGTFTGAYTGNTGNANFNAVLNQASYEIYQNPVKTITLHNLVAGQQYAVQLFALDDRGGAVSRYANFQDPADPYDYSDSFFMPDNAYVIGTFTASASTVVIQENFLAANVGGNLNAVVLRRLSGLPVAPVITTQPPSSVTVNAGQSVQLTVGASGTPLTYQWQRAAVGSSAFSNVGDANASGVTTAQLTITNLTTANSADYRVIVSNASGSVTSSPSSTLAIAPQITSQPSDVFVVAGATAQFTAVATGSPLNYQWQRGTVGSGVFTNINAANATGVNTSQLNIANVTANDVASYRLIVFNGSGSVTSSPAMLTIGSPVTTLVHRWNFNETNGLTAADSIGGANGTLVNGSISSGSSVSFNGTGKLVLNNPGVETNGPGSYVSIPGGLVSSLTAVTFEFWYDNTGLNNGNPWISFGGPIDGTTLHGTNFINFFARWSGSTTAFEIATTAGDSGVVTLGSRQQGGTFHWVLIYDPIAGKVSAYLNGSLQATASGITIPLSTVGTSVGYIGLSAWNQVGGNTDPNLPLGTFQNQYGFNGNGNYPYLSANMDEMRIYSGAMNTNAIAATQLLGPDQLLSNIATLSTTNTGGNLTLSWPIVNGAFTLETSPVLGAGAVWTPVNGTKSVVGSNYQITIPTGSGTAFFRLRQ